MIKNVILSLALLCPFLALAEQMQYIEINSPVLHIIDGTARVNIAKIANFRRKLRELHFLIKEIMVNGQFCSIKDLTQCEADGSMNKAELRAAFDKAIEMFATLAVPYMKDAEGTEDIIRQLVKQWSIQRNRPTTFLVTWSELTTDAQVVFYKNIKSFHDLTLFLEDLETFLGDFMKSCKKSLEQLKQAQQNK